MAYALDVAMPSIALEELLSKYAEMLAMRLAEELEPAERPSEREVRHRMMALASRFPGALREIDGLELREIRARVDKIAAVLSGESAAESWMEAVMLFHQFARGALCAKRWLGGRKHVDAEVERAYALQLATLPFPEDAREWAAELAQIAAPPQGRVTHLVFVRVARSLGTSEHEARRLVFGPAIRDRAARASTPAR
jgi:hypothetical protein